MSDKKKFNINGAIILAPIAGFTDIPFRKLAVENGASLVVTELISSEGIVRGGAKTLEFLDFNDDERPLSIQIFGKNPDTMAEAASLVEMKKPDMIDINFGCPAQKVNKSGSGAALLKDPERIRQIVDKVVSRVNIDVTAKIRLGWDDNSKNYRDVVKALQDGGVKFIAVHGRTREQRYSGVADWEEISKIVDFADVPIVGNGDIISYDDAKEKMKKYGCAAAMIGRAAIGNPWIFSGKIPTVTERIEMVKKHLDLMIERYGKEKGIILMRKHVVKYINGLRHASRTREVLMVATERGEILSILNDFLTKFH